MADQSTVNLTDVIDSEPDNAHTVGGSCTCDRCPIGEELIGGTCCVDANSNGICDNTDCT